MSVNGDHPGTDCEALRLEVKDAVDRTQSESSTEEGVDDQKFQSCDRFSSVENSQRHGESHTEEDRKTIDDDRGDAVNGDEVTIQILECSDLAATDIQDRDNENTDGNEYSDKRTQEVNEADEEEEEEEEEVNGALTTTPSASPIIYRKVVALPLSSRPHLPRPRAHERNTKQSVPSLREKVEWEVVEYHDELCPPELSHSPSISANTSPPSSARSVVSAPPDSDHQPADAKANIQKNEGPKKGPGSQIEPYSPFNSPDPTKPVHNRVQHIRGGSSPLKKSSLRSPGIDCRRSRLGKPLSVSYIQAVKDEAHSPSLRSHVSEFKSEFSYTRTSFNQSTMDNTSDPTVKEPKDIWWFPWPKKPKEPVKEKVDPVTKPFFWWWFWWILGRYHPDTWLHIEECPDRMAALAEKFNWTLPPIGYKARWQARFELVQNARLPGSVQAKFLFHTLLVKIRVVLVLEWIQERSNLLYVFSLAVLVTAVSTIWTGGILGFIPIDGGDEDFCEEFHWVWLFATNPLVECTIAYTNLMLFLGSVDPKYPWRPPYMYLPILFTVYSAHVLFWLPFVVDDESFQYVGIVTRLITLVVTMFSIRVRLHDLLSFDPVTQLSQPGLELPPSQLKRVKVFWVFLIIQTFVTFILFGYALLIKSVGQRMQAVLAFALAILTVLVRKIIQKQTVVLNKEMCFLLSGYWTYSLTAAFAVFSSPNFGRPFGASDTTQARLSQLKTYIFLAYIPFTDGVMAFVKQSNLWYRFRCWSRNWIRTIIKFQGLTYEAIPIETVCRRGRVCVHFFFFFFFFFGCVFFFFFFFLAVGC